MAPVPKRVAATIPAGRWPKAVALAAGVAVLAVACAASPRPPETRAVAVAPGVFVVPGAPGEPDAANRGRIGNAGFVVGGGGVAIIDTGSSYRHGAELLAEVARHTPRPVRIALITQPRQEFVFGGAALRERAIPIHMHRDAARLMAARCDGCLQTLRRTLGDAELEGTAVVVPDAVFDRPFTLTAIGRRLRVLHFGHSSGPGDVAVFDETSGTLFAGGLLDHRRIPDVQDGDIDGWLRALAALRALPIRTIVPAHGPPGDARMIDAVERYLQRLRGRLVELLDAGAALSEVPDAASLPEFETWDQYAIVHRRNASIVFLRLEREQLLK